MLYVKMVNGKADAVTTEYQERHAGYENRNDWQTMERAGQVAAELTQSTGELFIATDAGPNVWPRYDVIEAPKIGDLVSIYFNGDSYPAGRIVKISKSLHRIETSAPGTVFFRKRKTGAWVTRDGWSMIAGHHFYYNREF